MAIEFQCEGCGATLKVPDAKAGARGKCPKCKSPVVVPQPAPDEDDADLWGDGFDDPWESEDAVDTAAQAPPRIKKRGPSAARGSSRFVYQSKAKLVWAITGLMVVFVVCLLGYGAASVYQLGLLKQIQAGQMVDQQTLEGSDLIVQVPACAQLLVILATAVLWCVWKAGANRNARAISGNELEYTPGWTVGCYFVPIANLVWPYKAMKEIWENSNPSESTGLVGLWWGLWILNGIVGRVESQMSLSAESVDELISATYVSLAGVPLAIASTGAALALVWKINRFQEEAAGRL